MQLANDAFGARALLLGALLIPVAMLTMDLKQISASRPIDRLSEKCQGEVQAEAVLSREQLAQFLTIAEREPKVRVQQVLPVPFCQLPNLEVRAGAVSERYAYRLASEPSTWLIVLYEGEEYAGYQFSFD